MCRHDVIDVYDSYCADSFNYCDIYKHMALV